jgi:hypothetical protein
LDAVGVLGDMDDHDLGALLDAAVSAPSASDAALARIRRRAAMRVLRGRLATAAFVVVVVAAGGVTAAGLVGTRNGGRQIPPTISASNPPTLTCSTTTTGRGVARQGGASCTTNEGLVPGGPCPAGSVTLAFDPKNAVSNGADTFHWPVTATAHTNVVCRIHEGLDAAIETSERAIFGGVSGNPAENGEVRQDLLRPGIATLIAYLTWAHPCSAVPVQLLVIFHSRIGPPARLNLPRQSCVTAVSVVGPSHFEIDPGIPVLRGGTTTTTMTAKP